jgi:hypothetical protein
MGNKGRSILGSYSIQTLHVQTAGSEQTSWPSKRGTQTCLSQYEELSKEMSNICCQFASTVA